MDPEIKYYSKKREEGLDLLAEKSPFANYEKLIYDFEKTCNEVDGVAESIRKYKSEKKFIGFGRPDSGRACLEECCNCLEKYVFDLKSSQEIQKNSSQMQEIHIHNTNNNELKSYVMTEINISMIFTQTINTVDSLDLSAEEKKEIKSLLQDLHENKSNPQRVLKIINYMKKGYQIAVALSPLVSLFVPNLHLYF